MSDPPRRPFSIANLRAGGSIYLLGALLAMFIVIPVLQAISPLEWLLPDHNERIAGLLLKAAIATVLVTAAVTVAHSERPKLLILALIGFPVLVEVPDLLGAAIPSAVDALAETYVGGGLLYVVYRGASTMFRRKRVTADMVTLALCAYLLIGLAWTYLYQAAYILNPDGAFDGLSTVATQDDRTDELFYFSFVTLSTLGYGGITPIGGVTRSLAIVEAVIGQMFVAVVLARLVALQVSTSIVSATDDPESDTPPGD